MRVYDRICPNCRVIEEDVFVEGGIEDLAVLCSRCENGVMEWRPMIGSIDAREPFYDAGLGKTFRSFRQAERYAKANGKSLMTETEANNVHYKTTEERLSKGHEALSEAAAKAIYRVKNGYQSQGIDPPVSTIKE